MSNFPNKIDDDVTLPPVNNNITEIGGDAINALREAVFNIEEEIGLGASGNLQSIAARINVSINPDGYIRPSALDLSTIFPLRDGYIAEKAPGYDGIKESKLDLDYGTSTLYGYYKSVSSKTLTNENWINDSGAKIYSHVFGDSYQHFSDKILFSEETSNYLKNRFSNTNPNDPASTGNSTRDNSNLFNLITDLNSDYLIHQKMDGFEISEVRSVRTLSGDSYPSNFAHSASGVYLNSSNYSSIPSNIDSVQKFADYVDSNSMMLLGSRVQSLFTSGISRASRSSSLTNDGHGVNVIPETTAICYLNPDLDNPRVGYDVIELKPKASQIEDLFASKFSLVKPGDIATVTYTITGSPTKISVGSSPTSSTIGSGYSYVANSSTNTVSKINLLTKSVESTIAVGNDPRYVAINSSGTKVVVANYQSSFVTILNTSDNSTININCNTDGHNHVAISNLRNVAVVSSNNGKAFVIDLSSGARVAEITCGTKPVYCSINSDETIAAVVNSGSANVTFINLDTYQVISTIACGSNPVSGEFYSSNSNFIVVNKSSNNVSLIRTNSGIPTNVVGTIPCGASPTYVAITPNGKTAAIINSGASSISLIDLENESPLSIIYCDSKPNSIKITNDGTKALVTCSTNKLNVINLATNKVIAKISVGTNPVDVSCSENSEKAIVVNKGSNDSTLINISDVGVFQTQFTVREKKSVWSDVSSNTEYSIRIDGKNLFDTETATVKIDRSLFNVNKGGALSVSAVNDESLKSLIVSQPRGAVAIGSGFNPSQLSPTCRNLYLILYPNGNPSELIRLSAIDVTGDLGKKAGSYTIDDIIEATNKRFRELNYRFNAFSYNGQFGIMLADSYRNASFSIIAGDLDTSAGKYQNSTSYNNNIISYSTDGSVLLDPLGFSTTGSGIASSNPRDFNEVTPSDKASLLYKFPTKIFYPLKRNNFYVDGAGTEVEKFAHEKDQLVDENGDGYWLAELTSVNVSTKDFTYVINKNLKSSGLVVGKTAVVQPTDSSKTVDSPNNFGRFIIKSITFSDTNTEIVFTIPLVTSTPPTLDGYNYAIYFCSDSVSFNSTNIFEKNTESSSKFKKNFEIFINKIGNSFSSERARLLYSPSGTVSYETADGTILKSSSNLNTVDIVKISPKLRGYLHNTTNKISLKISYNQASATVTGYLYDSGSTSSSEASIGPTIYGKNKEIVRFYDNTGVDYIDFKFNFESDDASFSGKIITLQLFPSLVLDDELLLIASCQLNTSDNKISNIVDLRQFGNVSEKDISTSLINYINTPEKLIHSNGVISGFDAAYNDGTITISNGGTALVNGKFIQMSSESLSVPTLNEISSSGSNYPIFWAVCINESSQYEFVPLCDSFTGGVNAGSRNVTVRTVSSTNEDDNFVINSFLFKKLINDAKHLTPIYLIKVYVSKSGSVISFLDSDKSGNPELSDVRRFISNEPLNNSFTWASKSSELASYFNSFDAVKNWVNYYGDTSNIIKVRGTISIDASSNDFSKFDRPVVFEGQGSAARFDISSETFDIGQNITYKNIDFKAASGTYCTISQSGNSGYCTFDNVEFLSSSNNEYVNFDTIKDYNVFANCLFSSRVKRLYISDNCSFENVTFNDLYTGTSSPSEISLIKLGNNNSFINCKFLSINLTSSVDGDGYIITYDGSTGNNNLFDRCSFYELSSSRGGINLRNNNKVTNCSFINDITVKTNFLNILSGNLIEKVVFGESVGSESYSWIYQQGSSGYAISMGSRNTVRNVNGGGVVSFSNDGYAIKITGRSNVIDNINFQEIKSEIASILIANTVDNFIVNSKFTCMSKSGIYLASTSSPSDLDRVVIENNKLTYIYTGEGPEENSDYIRSSYGGLIFLKSGARNIFVKNCIFNKSKNVSADKCLVDSNGNAIQITNLVKSDMSQFPPFLSVHAISSTTSSIIIDTLLVDNCKFIGDSDDDKNRYYAAVALTSATNSNTGDSNKLYLRNVHITGNSSTKNNGLIIAGKSGSQNITAENVVISQNNFSYISAYSSPYRLNGSILIDGNSCYGIMSRNYTGTAQVNGLDTTGDMIISNNSTQFINVYVAGNK